MKVKVYQVLEAPFVNDTLLATTKHLALWPSWFFGDSIVG